MICATSRSAPGALNPARVAEQACRGRWDRARLEQVLSNFIGNAIKYGGGHPLEVAVARSSERAVLSATDHGVGIPEADRCRIFERFERAASARSFGGFGVGLWLSRTIVEGMGGTIRVDSEVGRGSTFSVEVPIATTVPVIVIRSRPPRAAASASRPRGSRREGARGRSA